jgi:hypothetical protein
MLIAAGQAHPVMPPLVAREAAGAVARLNEVIIDAVTCGEELDHLVSPVLGAAVEDAEQAASVPRESIARIVEHRAPLFRGLGVLPQAG